MVVIHRAHGFRFVIYTADHDPAHIHITGPGQAKINLSGPNGRPQLVSSAGIKGSDMRKLMAQVRTAATSFCRSGTVSMAQLTEDEFEAAKARGKAMLETEPRAVSARYDRKTGRVTVELVNGCTYMFPTHLVQDLAEASPDDLEGVVVDGMGFNLHWPRLDADLYVPALVAGVFGTRDWMRKALARQAGRTTSPAKAAAARENGRKGGRPRKHA
ncbi:MAG: DUF2442 domain-containing protein [Rhodobacterales bacterium]|nr:DUF2442 domain-containing protein [Rhodobacterales bacterium]